MTDIGKHATGEMLCAQLKLHGKQQQSLDQLSVLHQ